MIEMKEVYKAYPNGVKALNGVSVAIHPGEFVYVVGPSGAGKSTFIKMIYREEKPTKGQILINHKDLAAIKEKRFLSCAVKSALSFRISSFCRNLLFLKMWHLPLK